MEDAQTFSISEMADGTVALDSCGEFLAAELTGERIVIIDAQSRCPTVQFKAGVSALSALALNFDAGVLAVGAPDGSIALHEVSTGEVTGKLAMETQALTGLAFNTDGTLLAAGDDDGHLVVYEVPSGEEVRRVNGGKGVRALALYDSGSPILTGDKGGGVTVCRQALPPAELEGGDCPVTSLTCPPLTAGMPLVGLANGTINKVNFARHSVMPYLAAGNGPVRALWAGPQGCVRAVTGQGAELKLWSWTGENELLEIIPDLPGAIGRLAGQVAGWCLEVWQLVSAFEEVREQMRDEIASERAEMLDRLDSLDEATRDRIRPIVIASALSIFDSYSFDLAVRKIFKTHPLPGWILGITGTMLILLSARPVAALGNLRGASAWLTVVAIVAAAALSMRLLGRLGAAGRIVRALIAAAAIAVMLAGTRISFVEPPGMQHLAARWLPAADHLRFRVVIPYPIWLGAAYVVLLIAMIVIARKMLSGLRAPSALALRRRVLGGSLLHALLDIAYQAQVMTDESELAAYQPG